MCTTIAILLLAFLPTHLDAKDLSSLSLEPGLQHLASDYCIPEVSDLRASWWKGSRDTKPPSAIFGLARELDDDAMTLGKAFETSLCHVHHLEWRLNRNIGSPT